MANPDPGFPGTWVAWPFAYLSKLPGLPAKPMQQVPLHWVCQVGG